MAKKYALLVDLRKCVGCTSCQVSCKMENSAPMGKFRSKVDIADVGDFPKPKRYYLPKICNQCDEAPCVLPCPTKATYKDKNGIVMVNRDLCIGCGRCVSACPYGARFMHPYIPVKNDPSKYAKQVKEVKGKKAKDLRVVDKCDFCSHRISAGIEEPACVRNCMGRARIFGDINDPNSEISKAIKALKPDVWHPEYGTKPLVFIVAPDKEVFKSADGNINL